MENEEEKEEEEEEENAPPTALRHAMNDQERAIAELIKLSLLAKDTRPAIVFGKARDVQRGAEELKDIFRQLRKQKCSLIVVAFSMNDCLPCERMKGVVERIAKEWKSMRVAFLRVNINASAENRDLAREAAVKAFPTAQFFEGQTSRKCSVSECRGCDEKKISETIEMFAYDYEKLETLKERAFRSLEDAKKRCGEDKTAFVTLVKTVIAYTSNAIEKNEVKYKRILLNNKAFKERVACYGGEKCLLEFGFEKISDAGEVDDDSARLEIKSKVFEEDDNDCPNKREIRIVLKMLKELVPEK
jgi:thiol-disulfide isomerase/thioredoxin